MSAGFAYIWMYDVRDGCEWDFEALYGPDGAWVRLFRKSADYLGTDLLHDRKVTRRYVTVDRWESEQAHREFVTAHKQEFSALDRKGEQLTTQETHIGDFGVVGSRT